MYYPDEKKRISPADVLIRLGIILCGILAGFIVCRFFLVPVAMPDSSMEPSIKKGETILFLKTASFEVGDIVLVNNPVGGNGVLIKRVAAVEGDTVEMMGGDLILNGKQADFNRAVYKNDDRDLPIYFSRRDNMPVMKILKDEVFVINDNLAEAYDSRWFGRIQHGDVAGVKIYKW